MIKNLICSKIKNKLAERFYVLKEIPEIFGRNLLFRELWWRMEVLLFYLNIADNVQYNTFLTHLAAVSDSVRWRILTRPVLILWSGWHSVICRQRSRSRAHRWCREIWVVREHALKIYFLITQKNLYLLT